MANEGFKHKLDAILRAYVECKSRLMDNDEEVVHLLKFRKSDEKS